MEDIQKYELYANGLSFFGKINASVTHEINNVIGIIRELAGLMDDVLYMAQEEDQADFDKFKSISEKITSQTHRAEAIIKRLNRFAHSVDTPRKLIDITALLTDIAGFSNRFASLKNMTMKTEFPAESAEIESNPFLLFYAVFNCINMFLNASSQYSTVTMKYEVQDQDIVITVSGPCINEEKNCTMDNAPSRYLMEALHGAISAAGNGTGSSAYILKVPKTVEDK